MKRNRILPNSGKYKNARLSLLLIIIFSALNIAMMFANSYFLFSSRISVVFATTGLILQAGSGESVYLVVGIILAIISLIPYLLSLLLSKNRVGWMIVALVLFAVDTVMLVIDIPGYLELGDYSIFVDIIAHVIVLYELAVGVKAGFAMKKELAEAEIMEKQIQQSMQQVTDETTEENANPVALRTLSVTRKKSFVGCAVPIVIYLNGYESCRIKNGATQTITVPASAFELGVSMSNGLAVNKVIVESGSDAISYSVQVKMGFSSNSIIITQE